MEPRKTPSNGEQKPFIAVNFLPYPASFEGDALQLLEQQIETAKSHGFTHGWINPTCELTKESVCHRIDLDTGLPATLYHSYYAPDNPLHMRRQYRKDAFKRLIQKQQAAGFHLLIDFVWKHVSINSSLVEHHETWFGKTLNDIIEYKFVFNAGNPTPETKEVLDHLIKVIDRYLDPDKGFGFSGLRIDAASHMTPPVRQYLLGYLRENYPQAIILEECLFDRTQEMNIRALVASAEDTGLFSDYITSNLYYQRTDDFGALPKPSEMGDSDKIKLADKRAISFTGNHDHFSAGWSVLLTMAARLVCEEPEYIKVIRSQKVTALKKDNLSADKLLEQIERIARGKIYAECLEAEDQKCFRFLLPFANELARIMLNPALPSHNKVLNDFKVLLLKRFAHRTIPSMHGYFILFDELLSPFAVQRIFTNRNGHPLPQILLTAEDLMANPKQTQTIIELIKKDADFYPNIANFLKVAPVDELSTVGKSKKASKPGKIRLIDSMRLWLPLITDYLRQHPEKLHEYFPNTIPEAAQLTTLAHTLGIPEFISSLNHIYRALSTPRCSNYHTFSTADNAFIAVRQNDDATDIIILNLDPTKLLEINDIDLEKIALWYQSRLFPQEKACGTTKQLSEPFKGETPPNYAPDGYSDYWKKQVGSQFDAAYLTIVGKQAGHQTNLHLGLAIRNNITESTLVKLVSHTKSERQRDDEAFNQQAIRQTVLTTLTQAITPGQLNLGQS